jgi:hypothetical protein
MNLCTKLKRCSSLRNRVVYPSFGSSFAEEFLGCSALSATPRHAPAAVVPALDLVLRPRAGWAIKLASSNVAIVLCVKFAD